MEIIIAVLGSSVTAAIISGLFGLIKDRRKKKDLSFTEIQARQEGLTAGVRQLLYDRIKFLGRSYISKREISSEDLEDLIEMHRIYHNDLDGNGYLDSLMEAVKRLPIIK